MVLKTTSELIMEDASTARDEHKITIRIIGDLKYFADSEKGMQDRAKKYAEKGLDGAKKALIKKYSTTPGIENYSIRLTGCTCQIIKNESIATIKLILIVYPILDELQAEFLMDYLGTVLRRSMFAGEVKKSYEIN